MDALANLIEFVKEGTVYTIDSSEPNEERGSELLVTSVSSSMFGSGDPGFRSKRVKGGGESYFRWPKEGSDFEVDGTTLRIYNPSHAYNGGRRTLTHTFTFRNP